MADPLDILVNIGGDISKLVNSLNQAKSAIDVFKTAAEVLIGGGAIYAIEQFVEKMAELGAETERLSTILGVSNQEVAGLELVARESGGTIGQLAFGMERLQLQLAHAEAATTPAAAALKALHLTARDLIGLPLPEQMAKLADQISKYADGTNKAALVTALFGSRMGAQLLPELNRGADAIRELNARAVEIGATLDDRTTAALVKMDNAWIEVSMAARGFGADLVSLMAPALTVVAKLLTEFLALLTNIVDALKDLLGITAKIAEQKPPAPDLGLPNKEAIRAAIDAQQELIDRAKATYDRFKIMYDSDAAEHRISETKKVALTLQALQDEENAVRAAYNAELAIAGLTASERSAIQRRMNKELETLDTESLKIRLKLQDDYVKKWESALTEIQNAWDSQLRGLLAGTTTWSAALKNIFADLVLALIKELEKLIIVEQLALYLKNLLGGPTAWISTLTGGLVPAQSGLWEVGPNRPFPSYQVGSYGIPNTQLALLHAGEMVIPAGPAEQIRQGGLGGNNVTVAFNVSAIDGASVQQFFKQHATKIAAVVSSSISRNSSLRPTY